MPARKRVSPEAGGGRRRSGRLSTSTQKSSYFESDDDAPPTKKQRRESSKRHKREDEDDEDQYKEDEDEDAEDGDGDEDVESVAADNDNDNDDDDDDDDDDAPRKVQIIPLEKMRDTGGVPYEDDRVHRNTLLFLKDLKKNNKRPWLKSHDDEYRRALKDWQSFVEATNATIAQVDETVPDLPAKDLMFRIHRDVRFSKDQTPYKPHFSAAWSRTGKKGPYAVYYIHCEPGNAFMGGGLWHPEAAFVTKIRRSIDRHPERWRRAFGNPSLKKVFFPGVKASAGPNGVLKAFAAKNQSNALKIRPMGYDATHPDIELLKLKNYTVGTEIDAEMLTGEDAQDKVREIFEGLEGFVTFLNGIIMPDMALGDADSDDDEGDDDDDDDDDEEE